MKSQRREFSLYLQHSLSCNRQNYIQIYGESQMKQFIKARNWDTLKTQLWPLGREIYISKWDTKYKVGTRRRILLNKQS